MLIHRKFIQSPSLSLSKKKKIPASETLHSIHATSINNQKRSCDTFDALLIGSITETRGGGGLVWEERWRMPVHFDRSNELTVTVTEYLNYLGTLGGTNLERSWCLWDFGFGFGFDDQYLGTER